MSKTKPVKPVPVPEKGTFLRPGVKTETFLHSIGQDAESVGVVDAGADPRDVLTPAVVPVKEPAAENKPEKANETAAKKKAPSVKPAGPKKESVPEAESIPTGRRNSVPVSNLSTEEYLDFQTALSAFAVEGTKQDAYRKMISLLLAEAKKLVSEEDFALLRRMEERKLFSKIKKQKGE